MTFEDKEMAIQPNTVYVLPPTRMTMKLALSCKVLKPMRGLFSLTETNASPDFEGAEFFRKRLYAEQYNAGGGRKDPFPTRRGEVSGEKIASTVRCDPDKIVRSENIHCHDSFSDTTPPMTGPKQGAALVNPRSTRANVPLFAGTEIVEMMP